MWVRSHRRNSKRKEGSFSDFKEGRPVKLLSAVHGFAQQPRKRGEMRAVEPAELLAALGFTKQKAARKGWLFVWRMTLFLIERASRNGLCAGRGKWRFGRGSFRAHFSSAVNVMCFSCTLARMAPWWASAMLLAMDRPMPKPPVAAVREASGR